MPRASRASAQSILSPPGTLRRKPISCLKSAQLQTECHWEVCSRDLWKTVFTHTHKKKSDANVSVGSKTLDNILSSQLGSSNCYQHLSHYLSLCGGEEGPGSSCCTVTIKTWGSCGWDCACSLEESVETRPEHCFSQDSALAQL